MTIPRAGAPTNSSPKHLRSRRRPDSATPWPPLGRNEPADARSVMVAARISLNCGYIADTAAKCGGIRPDNGASPKIYTRSVSCRVAGWLKLKAVRAQCAFVSFYRRRCGFLATLGAIGLVGAFAAPTGAVAETFSSSEDYGAYDDDYGRSRHGRSHDKGGMTRMPATAA